MKPLEKLVIQFFKIFKWGGFKWGPSEVKQECQLQLWSGMIRERAESGQSVPSWYKENRISEKSCYYCLKELRQETFQVMEQGGTSTLAEVPLVPAPSKNTAKSKLLWSTVR